MDILVIFPFSTERKLLMKDEDQIPHIIHYCWFGGKEKEAKIQQCIDSWREFFPDYEIKEWNENNVDLTTNIFIKEAYHNKKYAFVSDVVRLQVLLKYGGIYFDTDVQVIREMQPCLQGAEIICGFESEDKLATCFLASKMDNAIIREILLYYKNRHFIKENGSMDLLANPAIWTEIFQKHGLICNGKYQELPTRIKVYPSDYFCAFNGEKLSYETTSNTYCIHHCSASWLPQKEKNILFIKRKISRIIGGNCYNFIKKLIGK